MARSPSMTAEQAETELGPRGALSVTSDNRLIVRKWLVAKGFPSLFCAGLSMRELALAYNMLDGSGLSALQRKLDESEKEGEEQPAPAAEQPAIEQPAPVAAPIPAAAEQPQIVAPHPLPGAPVAGNDPMAILRNLLLQGWTPGLDANAVRAIVQDQLAGIKPRVIEIQHQDKKPIRIEGIVHPQFERALNYLSKKGPNGFQTNLMLVGPAGCGKTHLIEQLAKALGVDHTVVACTAGTTEGDLHGRLLPGDGGKFEYIPAEPIKLYERGNALIAFDECDKLDPNMAAVANMPLANSHWYCHLRKDSPRVARGENVYFMGTANTFGKGGDPLFVGSGAQDEATRDRYIYLTVDYDKTLEESIAAAGGLTAAEMAGIWELRDRCREAQLRRTISTRAFQKACVMKAAGDTWREIRDRLLEGWTRDERAKVGV